MKTQLHSCQIVENCITDKFCDKQNNKSTKQEIRDKRGLLNPHGKWNLDFIYSNQYQDECNHESEVSEKQIARQEMNFTLVDSNSNSNIIPSTSILLTNQITPGDTTSIQSTQKLDGKNIVISNLSNITQVQLTNQTIQKEPLSNCRSQLQQNDPGLNHSDEAALNDLGDEPSQEYSYLKSSETPIKVTDLAIPQNLDLNACSKTLIDSVDKPSLGHSHSKSIVIPSQVIQNDIFLNPCVVTVKENSKDSNSSYIISSDLKAQLISKKCDLKFNSEISSNMKTYSNAMVKKNQVTNRVMGDNFTPNFQVRSKAVKDCKSDSLTMNEVENIVDKLTSGSDLILYAEFEKMYNCKFDLQLFLQRLEAKMKNPLVNIYEIVLVKKRSYRNVLSSFVMDGTENLENENWSCVNYFDKNQSTLTEEFSLHQITTYFYIHNYISQVKFYKQAMSTKPMVLPLSHISYEPQCKCVHCLTNTSYIEEYCIDLYLFFKGHFNICTIKTQDEEDIKHRIKCLEKENKLKYDQYINFAKEIYEKALLIIKKKEKETGPLNKIEVDFLKYCIRSFWEVFIGHTLEKEFSVSTSSSPVVKKKEKCKPLKKRKSRFLQNMMFSSPKKYKKVLIGSDIDDLTYWSKSRTCESEPVQDDNFLGASKKIFSSECSDATLENEDYQALLTPINDNTSLSQQHNNSNQNIIWR